MVEQWTENPCVGGSIPPLSTGRPLKACIPLIEIPNPEVFLAESLEVIPPLSTSRLVKVCRFLTEISNPEVFSAESLKVFPIVHSPNLPNKISLIIAMDMKPYWLVSKSRRMQLFLIKLNAGPKRM